MTEPRNQELEQSCRKIRRRHHAVPEEEADRISSLPPELVELIFSHLPLRDAIMTSALSRSWHYRWRSAVRHLDFHEDRDSNMPDDLELSKNEFGVTTVVEKSTVFVDLVDSVLNSVTGSIDSFKLSARARSSACIDRWMQYAVTHGARALDVSIVFYYQMMLLSGSLFSGGDLTSLSLSDFVVKFPSGLQGFGRLTKLKLHRFAVLTSNSSPFGIRLPPNTHVCSEGEIGLGQLISNSPCLTDLEITDMPDECGDLEISSPTLRTVYISSRDQSDFVCVKDCPNLERALIHVSFREPYGMVDILHGPCINIRDLDIRAVLTEPHDNHIPDRLPHDLGRLCSLKLNIDLRLEVSLMSALCILRSSPALKELVVSCVYDCLVSLPYENDIEVEGAWDMALDFWEGVKWQTPLTLYQLTSVRLDCQLRSAESSKLHLDFCKFLLANSPILQHFTVSIRCQIQLPSKTIDEIQNVLIQNDLTKFPSASENVKIEVEIQEV